MEVEIKGSNVRVKGPKGEIQRTFPAAMEIVIEDGQVKVNRSSDERHHRALHGMTRALINNMVIGVSTGFEKILEVNGVGYRAEIQGKNLVLYVGYSHPVVMEPPAGITFDGDTKTRQIKVLGYDKELVGQIAADIRKVRPPEPYKGKASSIWMKRSAARLEKLVRCNTMSATKSRSEARVRRHTRVRKNIAGTADRPRLNVFRSLAEIYAQVIDDEAGNTLVSASSIDHELRAQMDGKKKTEQARLVGKTVAERAKAKGIPRVVFDRGGYRYIGRVKALADGAREGGLEF